MTDTDKSFLYYPSVETHIIHSKYVAQAYKIEVMQPAQKRGETSRFPVLYATDGNQCFDMFKGISQVIQTTGHDAPRFILVGIGYSGDSPQAGHRLRVRDLTFPGYPNFNLDPPAIEGVLTAEPGARNSHGAEEFQQFIEHELIPLIDDRYLTVSGDRTYFGHSGGGGFGLFTLFERSHLFRNYIVSSPGLIYDGTSSAGIEYRNYELALDLARKFMASGKALDGTKLYMSVGSAEEFEPNLEQWQLTSSFYRMVRLLKAAAFPGLTLTTEVFPGETHMTVWPMAFIHGIQAVLGKGVST